jgi:hypothetical protein
MISLMLANAVGYVVAHWRWFAIGAAILVLVIATALIFRACKPSPSLDQKEIIEAQQAIAKEDRKVMIEILTNSTVREQGIDNSIKAAEEATDKAKREYSQLTNDELAAELEKRSKE